MTHRRSAVVLATAGVLGALLAAGPVSAAPSADTTTAAFQQRLDSGLQLMLDAVVGPGRAVVTTAVELDLDRVDTVRTTYRQDPSAGALSERLSRTSYLGDDGTTRYESSSADRTGALSSLRETRRTAPGTVKRLSIAVLVDSGAGRTVDLGQLKKLVGVAAGADPGRGDVVAVSAMPLHTRAAAVTVTGAPPPDRRPLAAVTAIATALLVAVAAWRRRRKPAEGPPLSPVRAVTEIVPAAAIAAAPSRDIDRRICPEQAGAVLRSWVGSGR